MRARLLEVLILCEIWFREKHTYEINYYMMMMMMIVEYIYNHSDVNLRVHYISWNWGWQILGKYTIKSSCRVSFWWVNKCLYCSKLILNRINYSKNRIFWWPSLPLSLVFGRKTDTMHIRHQSPCPTDTMRTPHRRPCPMDTKLISIPQVKYPTDMRRTPHPSPCPTDMKHMLVPRARLIIMHPMDTRRTLRNNLNI